MKGVSEGIEAWAKVMMPAIYVFGIILAVRAVTLGAPVNPDWSSMKGLNFVWNPDLSQLTSASTLQVETCAFKVFQGERNELFP